MNTNVLMCVHVAMLLGKPHLQAYLRCGGQVGFNAFEELVALQLVPVCLEMVAAGRDTTGSCSTLPVPMHIPVSPEGRTDNPQIDGYTTSTVYCHKAIQIYNRRVRWLEQPWHAIRFEWDHHHTQTPYNFLSVTHATVRKKAGLQTEDFSNKFRSVTIVGLEAVSTVGIGFLLGCRHLIQLDLPPLTNVQTIGCSFMECCTAIKSINLRGLNKLQYIAHSFLYNCESLEVLDLQNLHQLIEIGSEFMYGCSSLRCIDMSGMTSITSMGDDFMSGCRRLETISVTPSPLTTLSTIGGNFLLNCASVKQNSIQLLLLSGLPNVTKVGAQFMWGCDVREEVSKSCGEGTMAIALQEALHDGYSPKRDCCIQ